MPSEAHVEIYGLYDPESWELRYIGKANNSAKRLKTHIYESRREKRPVCLWVAGLIAGGKAPGLEVLETVLAAEWKAAERRLIAEHRKTANLLNLAPGGDMPSMSLEQRTQAGIRLNEQMRKNPARLEWVRAKRDMAKLYNKLSKQPDISSYTMRLHMKCRAACQPELYGEWAAL